MTAPRLLVDRGVRLGRPPALWLPDDEMVNPLTEIGDLYAGVWTRDPLWTPPAVAYTDPDLGLVLPGTAGNYGSVPDSAALDITGDMTVVMGGSAPDWTPAAVKQVVNKRGASGNRSWALLLLTDGKLRFVTYADGSTSQTIDSTASVPFTDSAVGYFAATIDVDNGAGGNDVTFWTSTDLVTWTQLGSTVTTGGTTSIFSGTAPVEFGAFSNTPGTEWAGTLSVARVYSGSGFTAAGPSGTLVLDVDFRRVRCETFTAATGQTVTVSSGAAVASWPIRGTLAGNDLTQATSSKQPTLRGALALLGNEPVLDGDGTDDVLELLTGVNLPQPYSFLWVGTHDTTGAARRMVGTHSGSNARGVGVGSAPTWAMNSGSAITGGTPAANTGYAVLSVFAGASSVMQVNGATVASGDAGTEAMDQFVLGAGRTAPSTYSFFHDGKTWMALAVPGDLRTHNRWPALKRLITREAGVVFA